MISGLIINPRLNPRGYRSPVTYTLEPYDTATGPVRAMQKFTVIMMTTIGSDPIRPWFGTKISRLCRMNLVDKAETKLLIRDEINSAIDQFFKLQAMESTQNRQTSNDLIMAIDLVDIDINDLNQISFTIRFIPVKQEAIVYSIELPRNMTDLK